MTWADHLRARRLGRPALLAIAALAATGIVLAATAAPAPQPVFTLNTLFFKVDTRATPAGGGAVVRRSFTGSVVISTVGDLVRFRRPLDVDGDSVADVETAVSLIDGTNGIRPHIDIERAEAAVRAGRKAPSLEIDVTLQDVGGLDITYGYRTPAGGSIPPLTKAVLHGSILDGFTEPLDARIETPRYHGPLTYALTVDGADQRQAVDATFDPMPAAARVCLGEVDAADGALDVRFDHGDDPAAVAPDDSESCDDHEATATSPASDVELTAAVELLEKGTRDRQHVDARVDRLPRHFRLGTTNSATATVVDYHTVPVEGPKPDLRASLRETLGRGTDETTDDGPGTHAAARLAGLPPTGHLEFETRPRPDGKGKDFVAVRYDAGGDRLETLDVSARNDLARPDFLEAPPVGADQFVAAASKIDDDGVQRFRAAVHVEKVAELDVVRSGEKLSDVVATTDVGDGTLPLRAAIDLDSRTAQPDPKEGRMALDTTVTPLPPTFHTTFTAATEEAPSTIVYESPVAVDVDAAVELDGETGTGCGTPGATCLRASVERVPPTMTITLPGEGGTDYALSHSASPTARPDVTARVDLTPKDAAKERTFADLALRGVPNEVRARIDVEKKFLNAAEFHACDWDFAIGACRGEVQQLGAVSFTVRDRPDREGLPGRPPTVERHVTVLQRADRSEVAGHVEDIRNLAFHQRDDDADGEADIVGGSLEGGAGDAFELAVDSDTTDKDAKDLPVALRRLTQKVGVHVDALPTRFSACLRQARDAAPPEPAADPLLAECARTDVLGRDDDRPLTTTPISVHYTAAEPATVTAETTSTRADREDLEVSGEPRMRTDALTTTVAKVPTELRADVIPPLSPEGRRSRPLELTYGASAPIDEIGVALQTRRADSVCEDQRRARRATCVEATLRDLPKTASVTFDPATNRQNVGVTTEKPQDDDEPLSIEDVRISSVSPDADADPLVVEGFVKRIASRLDADVRTVPPATPDGKPSLGSFDFDACGGETCGIGEIDLTATNNLADALLPSAPPTAADDLSLVDRGGRFRARAHVHDLARVGLVQVDDDGDPRKRVDIHAAFAGGGATRSLRAFVDRDEFLQGAGGRRSQRVEATLEQLPGAIDLCLRPPLEAGDPEPDAQAESFCDRQARHATAFEATLAEAARGVKPDIDVTDLRMVSDGGARVTTGSLKIADLGKQVTASFDPEPPPGSPTVAVRGVGDDLVGRATFDLTSREGAPRVGFPRAPLSDVTDVEDDAGRNHGNYVKATVDATGLVAKGSVPDVRRVEVSAEPCDPDDPRYPAAAEFASNEAPEYTCVAVDAADDQPLGLQVRTLSDQALAIDEGLITRVPDGGLKAALAVAPETIAQRPLCKSGQALPCRPPLLSLRAPREDQARPRLQARLAVGPLKLVRDAVEQVPEDVMSRRLGYEEPPADYGAAGGVRLKLRTVGDDAAVRAGLDIPLTRFLDLDPPSTFSCAHLQPASTSCVSGVDELPPRKGFQTTDIALKLVGSDERPDGDDLETFGPVAVFVRDVPGNADTIVTGATDPDPKNFSDNDNDATIKTLPDRGPQAADRGALLPGHLDLRLFIRDRLESPSESSPPIQYVQLDSRTNRPLTMALRLSHPPIESADPDPVPRTVDEEATNREGDRVPDAMVMVRNAPGLGGGVDDYDEPTFRARFSLLKSHDPAKQFRKCRRLVTAFGACVRVGPFGLNWIEAGLDARPDSGLPAARTVDALVDTRDRNSAHIRGWRGIVGRATDPGRDPAHVAAQVNLDVKPFDLTVATGNPVVMAVLTVVANLPELVYRGDMLARTTTGPLTDLKVGQKANGITLKADGEADLRTRLGGRLDGLPTLRTFVNMKRCVPPVFPPLSLPDTLGVPFLGLDRVHVAAVPAFTVAPSFLSLAVLPIVGCLAQALPDDLGDPAPGFEDSERPIDGISPVGDLDAIGVDEDPIEPAGIEVADGETRPLCGEVLAGDVVVHSGGTLAVEHETLAAPDAGGCDGTLRLQAKSITVEEGGTITGTGVVRSRRGSQPGTGGGAGHATAGGDSAAGEPGGGAYDIPEAGLGADRGSAGAAGTAAPPGRGGGAVELLAADRITIDGTVEADGAPGTDGDAACEIGGGGGSGGAIHLAANRVTLGANGSIHARGGAGGIAAGGGAGGRIGIDGLFIPQLGDAAVVGGDGGGGGECLQGSRGGRGNAGLGTKVERIATVTRADDGQSEIVPNGVVDLRVSALQPALGPLDVFVCHRDTTADNPAGLNSTALDPPQGLLGIVQMLATRCTKIAFEVPTGADGLYEQDLPVRTLEHGYHGFFALAVRRNADGADCVDLTTCFQELLPPSAQVKVVSDRNPPVIDSAAAASGVGCSLIQSGTTCVRDVAEIDLDAGDAFTGLRSSRCRITHGTVVRERSCPPGPRLELPLREPGAHDVAFSLVDNAGNTTDSEEPLRLFSDVAPPEITTRLELVDAPDTKNGWFKTRPQIQTMQGRDPAPGSGFDDEPLTIRADGVETPCGAAAITGQPSATCPGADIGAAAAGDGTHTIDVVAADRLGNVSAPSNALTVRVDGRAPTSALALSPREPDGADGETYRTKPLIAFGAVDNVGGSGVDPEIAPSGFSVSVDGGPRHDWDPADDRANTLGDGEHEVCFRATDLAGNVEHDHCETVRVDSTPPTVELDVQPAAPDGDNGFYTEPPRVTAEAAGAQSVRQQLDDGPWRDAAPVDVPAGSHVVRAFAVDGAGNASDLVERSFDVDTDNPSVRAIQFPPAPNARGFFRAPRAFAVAVRDRRPGSGPDSATAAIDGGAASPFTDGIELGEVTHTLTAAGRDRAGRRGAAAPISGTVDASAPTAAATGAVVESNRLVHLRFRAGDSIAKAARLKVLVFEAGLTRVDVRLLGGIRLNVALANPIVNYTYRRTLTVPGGFRALGDGTVDWDVRDDAGKDVSRNALKLNLLNVVQILTPRTFFYRVVAEDEAGNTTHSTESQPFGL